MKVIAKQNRDLIMINAQNTQNENDAEKIILQVPEKYEDYVKKIVFITSDGVVWDLIENNEYLIKRAITKYEQVKFYIWLTKDDVDFRTQEKTLKFNLNHKVEGEVTPEEQSDIERVLSILDSEIIKVENLDIDAIKVGDTTTITITDKEGNEKSVEILDGKDGTVGRDGVSPIITETKTQNGYDITITDITGTNTISLTNGDDGTDGQDGVDGISPTLTETKTQNGYDISITDKNGTRIISLTDGDDGTNGTNGTDGFSPVITETATANGYDITITDKNGTNTISLLNGQNGATGATGKGISSITKTGTSGLVDTYTIQYTTGNPTTYTVTNGANGQNGQDGYTPVKGTDYFTAQEIQDIEDDILENEKPEILYWNGKTTSDGKAQLNDAYDINQEKAILLLWKVFNITTYAQYIAYIPKGQLDKNTQYSSVYGYCYSEGENDKNTSFHGYYVQQLLTIRYLNGTVASVSSSQLYERSFLDTNTDYTVPYTPLYNGSPATKKYVDDSITSAITSAIGGAY